MQMRVKMLCTDAMLLCCALLISYVESIVSLELMIPVPGIRLGFANIAIMTAFFGVGRLHGGAVSFCRVFFSALIFGSVTSFWFSLCGALCAYLGLLFCDTVLKGKVSYIGTSVLCAAMHCVGQIGACAVILGNIGIVYYLAIMLPVSLITGTLNGIAVARILKSKMMVKLKR